MGIFDEIDKVMKKAEDEMKKAELDRHFKDLGDGINKAGSDLSKELNKATTPAPQPASSPAEPVSPSTRAPHPGYSRITAWVKSRYQQKIAGVNDPYQKRLELEQISGEATTGLSPKARKGFLEYLKKQNYEQLLK